MVMKKLLRIGLVGLCVSLPLGMVQAQELKVGWVNAAQVLEQAPQAEAARTKLEKEFAPRDRTLVAEQKALRQKEEKLARDGAVMSESERKKLERDILSDTRDLKRARDEFREDLNIRRNEELAKLQKMVIETIREIAKGGQYDLVVTDGVLFASDRVDMTPAVLARLKKDFDKATAGGGAPK